MSGTAQSGLAKEALIEDIFGAPGKSGRAEVVEIPLGDIADYHGHTFSIVEDDAFGSLVDSFRANPKAVEPITVRLSDEHGRPYECIAGHRRRRAAAAAGRERIWAHVTDMDDSEADIWMADSNLGNRRRITLADECRTLRAKYEAVKRQGRSGGRSDEQIAAEQGMSRGKVQDLLTLAQLTDGLLRLVDRGAVTRQAGKALARMTEDAQNKLLRWALAPADGSRPFKITPEQADEIVKLSKSDNFTERNVKDALAPDAPRRKPAFRLTEKDISGWFPPSYGGGPADKIELLERLVREHFSKEQ